MRIKKNGFIAPPNRVEKCKLKKTHYIESSLVRAKKITADGLQTFSTIICVMKQCTQNWIQKVLDGPSIPVRRRDCRDLDQQSAGWNASKSILTNYYLI